MAECEDVISSEEAFSFLRDVLGVASPDTKMATDPLSLLHEITSLWVSHIPFQTIKSIATPHDKRHLPTLQEVKSAIFAKWGGCCYDNNVGCYLILRALGYDVYLVASDIRRPSNHPIPFIQNLSHKGSRHMVDVGTSGYPTLVPIPLDFKEESPEYHQSYLTYKFVKRDDTIVRLHKAASDPAGAASFRDVTVDGWYTFVVIHYKVAVTPSFFKGTSLEVIYTHILPAPPFLTSPRVSAFRGGRFVCILNTTLLLEEEEGNVTKTYMTSRDGLVEAYAKYFPQLPQEMVEAALDDVNVNLDFNKQ